MADLISLSRIPLALLGCWSHYHHQDQLALLCFVLCVLSDILDGIVAKKTGVSLRGGEIDLGSDLFCEFSFVLILWESLPQFLGITILGRSLVQGLGLIGADRRENIALVLNLRRKIKLSTTLTWTTLFFVLMSFAFNNEASPIAEGLEQIALPYVFYPLCFVMELLSLYFVIQHLPLCFKKKEEGNQDK